MTKRTARATKQATTPAAKWARCTSFVRSGKLVMRISSAGPGATALPRSAARAYLVGRKRAEVIAQRSAEAPHLLGFFDAGGGTRTPDTRIMMACLKARFGLDKPDLPPLLRLRRGHF